MKGVVRRSSFDFGTCRLRSQETAEGMTPNQEHSDMGFTLKQLRQVEE
jgi:hypothetical protein